MTTEVRYLTIPTLPRSPCYHIPPSTLLSFDLFHVQGERKQLSEFVPVYSVLTLVGKLGQPHFHALDIKMQYTR